MLTRKTAVVATSATLLLAACGGGSEMGTVAPPPPLPQPTVTAVPDSAVASSTALVSYLTAQKADDDTSEALTLPTVDVAVSDTDEPQSL